MKKSSYTYILTNKRNSVLYVGVTSNLSKRIYEHKNHLKQGFTSKYNIHKLVYYEQHQCIKDAIQREKHLKGKTRAKKISLIESVNPTWKDLAI